MRTTLWQTSYPLSRYDAQQAEIVKLRSMLVGFATEKEGLLRKIARLTKENDELRHKCTSAAIAESTKVLNILSYLLHRQSKEPH